MKDGKYLEDRLSELLLKRQNQKGGTTPEPDLSPGPEKSKPGGIGMVIGIALAIGIIISLAGPFLFSPKTSSGPQGQILSPRPGEITTHEISVTGKTSNIEPGQYIWIAVDKPELELTWPKMFVSESNIYFRTTIFENGPAGFYNLSIYVLNQDAHEQWAAWLKAGKLGGLHMPPKKRRLATVRLMKENRI